MTHVQGLSDRVPCFVVTDRFYTALFSALEQTQCAYVA